VRRIVIHDYDVGSGCAHLFSPSPQADRIVRSTRKQYAIIAQPTPFRKMEHLAFPSRTSQEHRGL
jgi:hypothetical protein